MDNIYQKSPSANIGFHLWDSYGVVQVEEEVWQEEDNAQNK